MKERQGRLVCLINGWEMNLAAWQFSPELLSMETCLLHAFINMGILSTEASWHETFDIMSTNQCTLPGTRNEVNISKASHANFLILKLFFLMCLCHVDIQVHNNHLSQKRKAMCVFE